jgi:hypothetical protein
VIGETPSLPDGAAYALGGENVPTFSSLSIDLVRAALESDGILFACDIRIGDPRVAPDAYWFRCRKHPLYPHVIQTRTSTWNDITPEDLPYLIFRGFTPAPVDADGEDQAATEDTTSHLNASSSPHTGESDLQGAAVAAAYGVHNSPLRGADGLKEALKDPEGWLARDTFSAQTMEASWVPFSIWGEWAAGSVARFLFRKLDLQRSAVDAGSGKVIPKRPDLGDHCSACAYEEVPVDLEPCVSCVPGSTPDSQLSNFIPKPSDDTILRGATALKLALHTPRAYEARREGQHWYGYKVWMDWKIGETSNLEFRKCHRLFPGLPDGWKVELLCDQSAVVIAPNGSRWGVCHDYIERIEVELMVARRLKAFIDGKA